MPYIRSLSGALAVCALGMSALAGDPYCPDAGTVASHAKISHREGDFGGHAQSITQFSASLTAIGDLDGDGVTDLAVGEPGGPVFGFWVMHMNEDRRVRAERLISTSHPAFAGGPSNSQFASALAGVGDVNGDLVPDIVVGAQGVDNSTGSIWVVFLNADGDAIGAQRIGSGVGGFQGPITFQDRFGASVSSIGDFDGDGVNDVVVGAPGVSFNTGAAWLLLLNTDGTVKAEQKIAPGVGGFTGPLPNSANFGSSVAAGRINGDGVPDLIVGALNQQSVWVLLMNPEGTVASQQRIFNNGGGFNGSFVQFIESIAWLGDIDNDGVGDIAVGTSYDHSFRGSFWVFLLNPDGTVRHEQKISATDGGFTGQLDDGDRFGYAVARVGYSHEEGATVLAVSAFQDDDSVANSGAVWLLTLESCNAPRITQSPESVLLWPEGGVVEFSVSAAGDPGLQYQWRRNNVPLEDGGSIAGATTPTLTVHATNADIGVYDCLVSNPFGGALSARAVLGILQTCDSDTDGDGDTDFADLNKVISSFNTVCP